MRPLVFFLGGHDLEMLAIRELLEKHAPGEFYDKELSWGAKASSYRKEIEAALAAGQTPVLVELDDDIRLAPDKVAVVVDHHGTRAGEDRLTALEQVFGLLALPKSEWTRWHELVAANDRGYIPGLLAIGASSLEVENVRAADRSAQGTTADQEAEAAMAAKTVERRLGGRLLVGRMSHSKMAALEDRLHAVLGGPGVDNLLVVGGGEVNFSGEGKIVGELNRRFPGGWFGGNLPLRGFWGFPGVPENIVEAVEEALSSVGGP